MLQFCLPSFIDWKFALFKSYTHDVTPNNLDDHLLPEDFGGILEICDRLWALQKHTFIWAAVKPAYELGEFYTVVHQRKERLGSMRFYILRPSDLMSTMQNPPTHPHEPVSPV